MNHGNALFRVGCYLGLFALALIPLSAQQTVILNVPSGTGSGNDSSVQTSGCHANIQISYSSVYPTVWKVTVTAVSGHFIFSNALAGDPWVSVNGTPGTQIYAGTSATFTTGTLQFTIGLSEQTTGSPKYYFGSTTITPNPPDSRTSSQKITNPYNFPLTVTVSGIDSSGTSHTLQTVTIPANSTSIVTAQGDAAQYPNGVTMSAATPTGYHWDSTTGQPVYDGTSGALGIAFNSTPWNPPYTDGSQAPSVSGNATVASTSGTGSGSTATTAANNVQTGATSGTINNTVNNINYVQQADIGTGTSALTNASLLAATNGIITAVGSAGQQVQAAVVTAGQNDVTAINAASTAIVAAISSGGGGGSDTTTHTLLTSTNTKLDTLHTDNGSITTAINAVGTGVGTLHTDLGTLHTDNAATVTAVNAVKASVDLLHSDQATAATAAATAASTFSSTYNGTSANTVANDAGTSGQSTMSDNVATLNGGGTPYVVPDTSTAPTGSVDVTVGGGSGTVLHFLKNPFDPDGPFSGVMSQVATFVKQLIAWAIVFRFFLWALRRVRESVAEFFRVAPFSKGLEDSINSIKIWGFGGGLGYPARVAALAVFLPVVLTMPLIIITAMTTGLPWSTITSTLNLGVAAPAGGSMIVEAWNLSGVVFPWATALAAPTWYLIVEYGLMPTTFFWQMFKQFLPS